MYKLVILALCVASATAATNKYLPAIFQPRGVVDPVTPCGGVGIPIELRVSGCDGRCQLVPGTRYDIEGDITAGQDADSLNLLVDVIFEGVDRPVMDVTLENSAVEAGKSYTIRYSIIPESALSGNSVFIRFTLYHTGQREVVEICVSALVDIL